MSSCHEKAFIDNINTLLSFCMDLSYTVCMLFANVDAFEFTEVSVYKLYKITSLFKFDAH